MVNTIKKASNKFTKGLIMDFSPENTQNEVLTHALNATLLTFNGNEMSLLNDMGNARVETAYLPEGYIPVGTCEYGGIIYIVSYNPLENKSQIGCFPSPERNVSHDELGESDIYISKNSFLLKDENGNLTGDLSNVTLYILLKNDVLNPGDKFIVYADEDLLNERLKDLFINISNDDSKVKYELVPNPVIALHLVSIEDSGKIVYLNSDVRQYETTFNGNLYKYHILCGMDDTTDLKNIDIDSYRNILSSGYSVFKSKISGKLALLAELITIDSYSVTHEVIPTKNSDGDDIPGSFDIIIHTDVTPTLDEFNYNVAPKLKYYFLEKSLGYLYTTCNYEDRDGNAVSSYDRFPLFNDNLELNDTIFSTPLSTMFEGASQEASNIVTQWKDTYLRKEDFKFPKSNTYQGNMHKIDKPTSFLEGLYYKDNGNYVLCEDINTFNAQSEIYEALFLPEDYQYKDVKLATLQIPNVLFDNKVDLPFKYDYTIVPCMDFGKLQHLLVSNSVDFSKLHLFDLSNFNVWKYRVDGDLLRLTFGAEIFDTFETDKVDGLFLEFYDLWGFAGSIEISDKKSYSGVFTKILSLNTLGTLSTKSYSHPKGYTRNINIYEKEKDTFYLGELKVIYNSEDENDGSAGWKYEDSQISFNDDCGVLYSNVLYGVKAFITQTTTTGEKKYIYKKDFFLYTLPILNDYFYTIDDFNTIQYPQLDFLLTYKLVDTSNKSSYDENGYNNGYNNTDFEKVRRYNNGEYLNSSLEAIKYYKYRGTTNLYLEIGLLKDYENCNLRHHIDINKCFSCSLKLVSDSNPLKSYFVKSDVEGLIDESLILNYGNDNNLLGKNKIGFNNEFSADITLSEEDFYSANFLSHNSRPIPINYDFIVGYSLKILNIVPTEVQTTTVCALCHKDAYGEYNYSDFGIYRNQDDQLFYWEGVLCNSGSSENSIFGICKQKSTTGNVRDLLDMLYSITTPTSIGATNTGEPGYAGMLNSGTVYKEMLLHIGKLAFCQPHSHAYYSEYGTNVYDLAIPSLGTMVGFLIPSTGAGYLHGHNDDAWGTWGEPHLYYSPRYNMSINTALAVTLYNTFISSLEWNINYDGYTMFKDHTGGGSYHSGWYKTGLPMREFIGFDGQQISTFARKLINTMSKVYAYNPDYDLLKVLKGSVSLLTYNPSFISNLLSVDSKFTFEKGKCLNDYIYFGLMCFKDYLTYLNNYSDISIWTDETTLNPHLEFKAGQTYCGTSDSYFLLSSLTYNTAIPTELESELNYDFARSIVVKHSNGDITVVSGEIARRKLYGYSLDKNSLIELDVTNYYIEEDGNLVVDENCFGSYIQNTQLDISDSIEELFSESGKNFKVEFDSEVIDMNVKCTLSTNNTLRNMLVLNNHEKYIAVGNRNILSVYDFDLEVTTTCNTTSDLYNYIITPIDLDFSTKVRILTKSYPDLYTLYLDDNDRLDAPTGIEYSLNDLSELFWINVFKNDINTIEYRDIDGNVRSYANTFWWASVVSTMHYCNKKYISLSESITYKIGPSLRNSSNTYIDIYQLMLHVLNCRLVRINKSDNLNNKIFKFDYTSDYSKTIDHKYVVHDKYKKTCLKGCSLTINDLVYNPSLDHRLAVRDDRFNYDPTVRGIIPYRKLGKLESWASLTNPIERNSTYLYTGPCFTPNTLYNE